MKSVVVFCGASRGDNMVYYDHAYTLGRILAGSGITVVFGGGKVGLMGALAEGAIHHDGRVIGVIPSFLRTKEIANEEVSQLVEVETMHERKMTMHGLSQGIIALPGGWGTMEELFEMMTWAQLGIHQKPIGILNVNGFYDPFLAMMNTMVSEGFLKPELMQMLLVDTKVEDLIRKMQNYTPPEVTRYAGKEEV
ncbi:MAG: TIGR00730 family Rossman fold protein [Flavipsychrobacter sp.]|nr:TIGR00730 family Rossman fold protein [Flavipsychrobacter sp.]